MYLHNKQMSFKFTQYENQQEQNRQGGQQMIQRPMVAPDFEPFARSTLPFDKIYSVEKTFVIDSRQRNCHLFPSPSFYRVDLGEVYKNVTSIELRGSCIPRSSYNVHSTNKYIDFSIGSTVVSIVLTNGGQGYTSAPTVTLSAPVNTGTQATATAVVDLTTQSVTSIIITANGSGYLAGSPPAVMIAPPNVSKLNSNSAATAYAIVGTHYSASLREANYVIGGNNVAGSTLVGTDLILELQNALNYAATGSYNEASVTPFSVRLVNQYPTLTAVGGTPEAYNTNGAMYNRIQITNVNSDHWELLFCSGPNRGKNAANLLGFNWDDYTSPVATSVVPTSATGASVLVAGGLSLRADNDYDLLDDPKYVIMEIWSGNERFERLDSKVGSVNGKFAVLFYDAVDSNCITDTGGTTVSSGGFNYLSGPVTKNSFWKTPGLTRPLKGFDLDQKKLNISPEIGKLDHLWIKFTVFSAISNGEENFYNFQGRNHTLLFSIKSEDTASGQKS